MEKLIDITRKNRAIFRIMQLFMHWDVRGAKRGKYQKKGLKSLSFPHYPQTFPQGGRNAGVMHFSLHKLFWASENFSSFFAYLHFAEKQIWAQKKALDKKILVKK